MHQIFFLVLRRMRFPLVMLVVTYAVSVLGFVLIPGIDDSGAVYEMDFFHAFYFVSYMATTIGFGELPYAFTDTQRLWAMITIYLTVITWLYAIGKILSLAQSNSFRMAVKEQGFLRDISRMTHPFYIICGYGDTGRLLVRMLVQRGIHAVVVDSNKDRIDLLQLEDHDLYIPGVVANAKNVSTLKQLGITLPKCRGVIALSDKDDVNLKIAITAKLLHPGIPVICRAETHDAADNMASFGTDHIINPFDIFSERLRLALHAPGNHLLNEWVTGMPGALLPQPLYPPRGKWILCGYGRFGKAIYQSLHGEGIDITIIEAELKKTGCVQDCIKGRGTEANTLIEAGITQAVGIVAGTDNDSNNLSITMTAAELNPDLFMVSRQNRHDNREIFNAALLDLVMKHSDLIARDIFAYITNPLLPLFMRQVRHEGNECGNLLVARISAVVDERVPEFWSVTIDHKSAPALYRLLDSGEKVRLKTLMLDPRDPQGRLKLLPLMSLSPSGEVVLLPELETVLHIGERFLFCGVVGMRRRLDSRLHIRQLLDYLYTGVDEPSGLFLRWLMQRLGYFGGERG